MEVSTGDRPEPMADLLGLAAWGYILIKEQGKQETSTSLPLVEITEWKRGEPWPNMPLLKMNLPIREQPYSLLFRMPVWIPDSVPGATIQLIPSRSESICGTMVVRQRAGLRWAVSRDEAILHLGLQQGNWVVGWGLPGIAGAWANLVWDSTWIRVPVTFVNVEESSSGIRVIYQCISPKARGLQGSITASTQGANRARLSLDISSFPEKADLHSIDLLGWFYHPKQEDVRLMTDESGGRLFSPQDTAPWSSFLPERDLPLLVGFSRREVLVMDWPSTQSAVMGPLGPFHLAGASMRALQGRQLAFGMNIPAGHGQVNLLLEKETGDWISAAQWGRKIASERWGRRRNRWHRPHVFIAPDAEERDLSPVKELTEGWQASPKPVLVPMMSREESTWLHSSPERNWIQASWEGAPRMEWTCKTFFSRHALGSNAPFVRGRKSDIWTGSCWSVTHRGTVPFLEMVAGPSWVLHAHPGETWTHLLRSDFASDLALGRPPVFFLHGEHANQEHALPSLFLSGVAQCGGVSRSSILTHAMNPEGEPSCRVLHLNIPKIPCRLKGFTGIADEADCGDGITFQISIDGKEHLFLHHSNREWEEFQIDLSPWAGMSVDVQFMASTGPHGDPTGDWALWGDLLLESYWGEKLLDLVTLSLQASPCQGAMFGTKTKAQEDKDLVSRTMALAAKILSWSQDELSGKALENWIVLDGGGAVAEYEKGYRVFLVGEWASHLYLRRGVLPQGGFFFEGRKGEVGLVTEWDGRTYGSPTLFWVLSLDRRPLGRSKHVRVVRVEGDPLLRIRSFGTPSKVKHGTLMESGEGWYEVHVPDQAEVWLR